MLLKTLTLLENVVIKKMIPFLQQKKKINYSFAKKYIGIFENCELQIIDPESMKIENIVKQTGKMIAEC